MGYDSDTTEILIVSPFCTWKWKYKHNFIDINRACEVNINGTSACISHNKIKNV